MKFTKRLWLFAFVLCAISLTWGQTITESFEGASFPPTGWTNGATTLYTYNGTGINYAHGGTHSARFPLEGDNMYTFRLANPATINWYARQEGNGNCVSHIRTSTDGINWSADLDSNHNMTNGVWNNYSIAIAGSNLYVMFIFRQGGNTICYLDDITMTPSSTNYYWRTLTSGNWNSPSTWQYSGDNINWYNAFSQVPDNTSLGTTVRNTHTVTVTTNATTVRTTVESTGSVNINNGVTLTIGNTTATTDMLVNGTISTIGTGIVNGAGEFSLSSGANLVTGHTSGISTTAATGCIQVTGTKTFSTAANYTFNGMAAQVTGNALTQTNNLTINNTAGVSLSGSCIVNGTLTLTSVLGIGANTLTINGIVSTGGSGGLTGGANSDIVVGGSAATATIPAVILRNLTVNRSNGITLGGDITVGNVLTLTSGNFAISAHTLTLNGSISAIAGTWAGGITSGLIVGGTGSAFALPAITLNNLEVARANGIDLVGNVVLNSATMTAGDLRIGNNTLTVNSILYVAGGVVQGGTNADMIICTPNPGYVATLLDELIINPAPAPATALPNDVTLNAVVILSGKLSFNDHLIHFYNKDISFHSSTGSVTSIAANMTNEQINYGGFHSINRVWQTSGTVENYVNIIFTYPESESASDQMNVWYGDTAGSTWTLLGTFSTVDNGTTRSLTATGITALSGSGKGDLKWTLGETDGTLPVELSSFTALLTQQNYVRLDWITQSETGVLGYYIYRNTISNVYSAELVSPLIAATNTSQEVSYSYVDREIPSDGTYYYWLQNQDINGSYEFHGPLSTLVQMSNNDSPVIPMVTALDKPYPNPFNPSVTISYELSKAEHVLIQIYNNKGQLVRTMLDADKNPGITRMVWDGKTDSGKNLPTGIYFIKMDAGRYSNTQKIIMMK